MTRNSGKSSGPIDCKQANIIAALVALHRGAAARGEGRGRTSERHGPDPARDIADIGDHGGRGRRPAGPGTDQGDRRDPLGVDRDGVGHAHDLRERRAEPDHGGMHPLLDAVLGAQRDPQQLDPVAEFRRGRDVLRHD